MTSFIRSVAYATAPVVAFLYTLGYMCGTWLHEANSDLALFHRSLFSCTTFSPQKTVGKTIVLQKKNIGNSPNSTQWQARHTLFQ